MNSDLPLAIHSLTFLALQPTGCLQVMLFQKVQVWHPVRMSKSVKLLKKHRVYSIKRGHWWWVYFSSGVK